MQIADRIEAIIQTKKFNHLGGLLLDRQVRAIISTASDLTQQSVRERFSTLSQMSMLLSLESTAEVKEFWGESSDRTLHLSLDSLMDLRTDFERD